MDWAEEKDNWEEDNLWEETTRLTSGLTEGSSIFQDCKNQKLQRGGMQKSKAEDRDKAIRVKGKKKGAPLWNERSKWRCLRTEGNEKRNDWRPKETRQKGRRKMVRQGGGEALCLGAHYFFKGGGAVKEE